MPRIAPTLIDFVRADDGEYLKYTEAVLRIFDRQDWLRVNRARARLKVMVDKIGIEAMREQVEEELQGDWVAERDFSPADRLFDARRGGARPRAAARPPARRTATCTEFRRFREANVEAQRQQGFSTVQVKVPRGDLTPEQFRGLADDHARVLRRLRPHHRAPELRAALGPRRGGLRRLDAGSASSASATPAPTRSTTSCRAPAPTPASSASPARWGSTARSRERIEAMEITDPLTRGIHIKMSGCPNGCSQHHIGNIGFYGASIKVGEHTIPAYVAHIGGNYEGGEIVYGTRLKVRLPAKRVPEAVERWIRNYEAEREEGEGFNAYAARVGTKEFEDAVRDLAMPVEFGLETMNEFIDWTKKVPFEVIRGEGECAV